jgi:hypothetical protein
VGTIGSICGSSFFSGKRSSKRCWSGVLSPDSEDGGGAKDVGLRLATEEKPERMLVAEAVADLGTFKPTRRIMLSKLDSIPILSLSMPYGYACRVYRDNDGGVGTVLILDSGSFKSLLPSYPPQAKDFPWLSISPNKSLLILLAASPFGVLPNFGNKPRPTDERGARANCIVTGGDIPSIKSTESSNESLNILVGVVDSIGALRCDVGDFRVRSYLCLWGLV